MNFGLLPAESDALLQHVHECICDFSCTDSSLSVSVNNNIISMIVFIYELLTFYCEHIKCGQTNALSNDDRLGTALDKRSTSVKLILARNIELRKEVGNAE